MCGLATIYPYHYAAPPVDVAELDAIRDRMRTRGPDGLDSWFAEDARVGLAHRRLAVIDLARKSLESAKAYLKGDRCGGDLVETLGISETRKSDLRAAAVQSDSVIDGRRTGRGAAAPILN